MVAVSMFNNNRSTSASAIFGALPGGQSFKTSMFGNQASVPFSNLFGALPRPPNSDGESANGIVDALTVAQYNALKTIYTNYVVPLANKQYEQISTNVGDFMKLTNALKAINAKHPTLKLLLQIISNVLTGSLSAQSMYATYAYNEIAIIAINKRIEEILSNVNTVETSTGAGQLKITKAVKLAPIYSYYVHLYGLPEFGVGFDPAKLAFLRTIPAVQARLSALENPVTAPADRSIDTNVPTKAPLTFRKRPTKRPLVWST